MRYELLISNLKLLEKQEQGKQYDTFSTRWIDVVHDCRIAIEELISEDHDIRQNSESQELYLSIEHENNILNSILDQKPSYICVADCPELDLDGYSHCRSTTNYDEYVQEHGCCRVGNIPIWKRIDDMKSGV